MITLNAEHIAITYAVGSALCLVIAILMAKGPSRYYWLLAFFFRFAMELTSLAHYYGWLSMAPAALKFPCIYLLLCDTIDPVLFFIASFSVIFGRQLPGWLVRSCIITAMTSLGYSILTHQPDMTLVLGTFTAVVLLTLSLPRILHDPSAKWFIASVILTALARISMVNGCTGNLLDIVVDALRFTETGVCICRLLGLACFVFGSQARSIPKSKKQ